MSSSHRGMMAKRHPKLQAQCFCSTGPTRRIHFRSGRRESVSQRLPAGLCFTQGLLREALRLADELDKGRKSLERSTSLALQHVWQVHGGDPTYCIEEHRSRFHAGMKRCSLSKTFRGCLKSQTNQLLERLQKCTLSTFQTGSYGIYK